MTVLKSGVSVGKMACQNQEEEFDEHLPLRYFSGSKSGKANPWDPNKFPQSWNHNTFLPGQQLMLCVCSVKDRAKRKCHIDSGECINSSHILGDTTFPAAFI